MPFTWGIPSEFEADETNYGSCCELDEDKFVAVYCNAESLPVNLLSARAATVSDKTPTWGTVTEGVAVVETCCAQLDTNKFVICYQRRADDQGWAVVATVSGTNITFGTPERFSANAVHYISCCKIAANKFAVAFSDADDGDAGKICITPVMGTNIAFGAVSEFEAGDTRHIACTAPDDDKIFVSYKDHDDGEKGKARAATIVLDVPTWGAISTFFDTSDVDFTDCCKLDTDKVVVVFRANNTYAIAATISGATITFAIAGIELYDNDGNIVCCAVATDSFVAIWSILGGSSYGAYCTVSGTIITVDSASNAFILGNQNNIDVCLIDTAKVAYCYEQPQVGSDPCIAIIGDVPYTPPVPAVTGLFYYSDTIQPEHRIEYYVSGMVPDKLLHIQGKIYGLDWVTLETITAPISGILTDVKLVAFDRIRLYVPDGAEVIEVTK